MKKILFSLIFIIMLTLGLSQGVFALSGSGTEADPYLISTPSDVVAMHNDLDGYYKLTANIDMKDIDFEPIGNENEGAFTGTIDGNGFTISNLDINLPGNKYVGLVGYLEGGTVKNLTLENVDACGYNYVGGLVGFSDENSLVENCEVGGDVTGKYIVSRIYVGGLAGYNCGKIADCSNSAIISSSSNDTTGGIVGHNGGIIINCSNKGSVSSYEYTGGIAGDNYNGTISNCTNSGDISSNDTTGGIVGHNGGIIINCSNKGSVSSYEYTGGIAGDNYNGTISNCTNSGDISSSHDAGGIAGRNRNGISNCFNSGIVSSYSSDPYAGGIVGDNSNGGTISNCTNSGSVSASWAGDRNTDFIYAGGIAGHNYSNGIISNCTNSGRVSSSTDRDYTYAGGIVADNNGTIINCANSGRVSSITLYAYEAFARGIVASRGIDSTISNCFCLIDTSNDYIAANCNYAEFLNALSSLEHSIWFTDPETNSGFPQLVDLPCHIVLNECILLMKQGEASQLQAFIDGVSENVTWSTENTDIVSISADGKVTALATGDAVITATNSEGMKANCLVHITKDVSGISLNETETTIKAGGYKTLTYTLNPIDANEAVFWASDNEQVATVDNSGKVTAKKVGTANITCTTVTSNKSATCTVTVVGNPITSLSLPSSATVNKGTPYKLNLSVSPSEYAGIITWTSSDESVATVSNDGTVTGIVAGTAVITARSDNGRVASCTVTVKIPAERVVLDKVNITLQNGYSEKITATLYPADSTDTVSWSSSSSYVPITSDGTVTANRANYIVTITAVASSGVSAYCTVTTVDVPVPVSSVTLNNTELTLTKADTAQLTATVAPSNATDKTVTWTSSDENIVTVNSTGVVTAVSDGVALITAETTNGMYHECVVKVISAQGPSIVIDTEKASPDSETAVKFNIVKNPGISAYKFTINYDSTILTPIAVVKGSDFDGTLTTNLDDADRTELNVVWYSTNDVESNGELFTVKFDVSESAQYGDSSEVSVTYGGKDICNTNGDYIALYTQGAVVNIKEPKPGDIYEDDEINVYDLTLLARHITFLEDFTSRQEEAGDVNNDLLIDIKDVVKLSQYLVGWTGATLMSETATLMSDEKTEISVGTASVSTNREVNIPVIIKNNPGITGLNYKINYSTDELEIISITPNAELLTNNFITNLGYEDERGLAVTWHQNDNMTSNGVLFTINAKLKDGVDVGTITIVPADNNMCNENGENVISTYTDGYILAGSYVVKEQSVSNSTFTCNMYFDKTFSEQSATAIVAFYNGKMFVKMATAPITVKEGKVIVIIPCEEVSYTTYKVFVWQDLVSMKPLVEAK